MYLMIFSLAWKMILNSCSNLFCRVLHDFCWDKELHTLEDCINYMHLLRQHFSDAYPDSYFVCSCAFSLTFCNSFVLTLADHGTGEVR